MRAHARKPLGTSATERDGRQRTENEMLKVKFIETSGAKDLGGCDGR